MVKPVRQFIDGRFGQLHLRVSTPFKPHKNPLICLHMFPQSSKNLVRLIEAISEDRLVIAPDFPGYGESDPPDQPIDSSDYAATVWDVVAALGLDAAGDQIDLFGIHAGSKLAVEAACQRPESVRRIALSSAAFLKASEIAAYKNGLGHIPLDEQGSRFRKFWELQILNRGDDAPLELLAENFAEMLRGGEKYHWGHSAVFDYNAHFVDRVQSLKQPILLINPRDDLYEMTPRTAPFLHNGKLLDRPDWTQGFLHNHADDVAEVICTFLDETASSQPIPKSGVQRKAST